MVDVLNRVLFIIIGALVAAASFLGVLIATNAITSEQLNSVIPFQQAVTFFQDNPITSSLVLILALVIVMALSLLWLRGQYLGAVRAVAGGQYDVESKGPGTTTVDYDVVIKAIDKQIMSVPGVIDSMTKIYSQRDGELFAHSSVLVKRDVDIHSIDNRIRESINKEWLDKFDTDLARHDITIGIEPTEKRVA